MSEGYVYFASAGFQGDCRIKVGYSLNPEARIGEFFPRARSVKLLAYAPARMCDEKAIHKVLDAYKTDRNEWFRPCRRLDRMIAYCQREGALPPQVIAAGDAWQMLSDAKRAFRKASADAGHFFADGNKFGIEWLIAAESGRTESERENELGNRPANPQECVG